LTLALHARGVPDRDLARLLRTFNANAPAFRDAGLLHLEAAAHGSSSEDTSRERTAPDGITPDGETLTDARRAASHDTPGTGTP
jgi:hypothetical protein